MMYALGIDIGGVIMGAVKEDREWQSDPPVIDGAFAAVARLHRERFSCWLVSRCKAEVEPVIVNWLERHDFFNATGIDRQRVVFCRVPSDKARICRALGITCFVDDRLAVLRHMIGVVPNLYLFLSRASELEAVDSAIEGIQTIRTWTEVMDALLDSVALASRSR